MHRHTLAPIDVARRLLATERDQLRAEARALERFTDCARSLGTGNERVDGSPPSTHRLTNTPSVARVAALRRAYRETVMSVDHYEDVYDESLLVHVNRELGPDVAEQLASDGTVTALLVSAVLTAVDRSSRDRRTLLDHLEEEASSLDDAWSTLESVVSELRVQSESPSLDGSQSLGELDDRCRSVVEARQTLIQRRHLSPVVDGHDLCHYLYTHAEGNWTYPVLNVAATVQADLETIRQRERRSAGSSVSE